MASHAGLINILKTKEGYIDEFGGVTKDREKAKRIYGLELGFCSAYEAYERLGFNKRKYNCNEIKYESYQKSYDSKIGDIEDLFTEIGMDRRRAIYKANYVFNIYNLYDEEKYNKYIKELTNKVIEKYKGKDPDKIISINDTNYNLYKVDLLSYSNSEYSNVKYYSNDGKIECFSFKLKNPHVEKYFDMSDDMIDYYNNYQNEGIIDYIYECIKKYKKNMFYNEDIDLKLVEIDNGILNIYYKDSDYKFIDYLLECIRDYYCSREMHITRMFGSYILLLKDNDVLKAVKATSVPIKYCPLMYKLLKEVSGKYALDLIKSIESNDLVLQEEAMCKLINETVIKTGYFDTNRPLNSCEKNVLFGASETLYSAFSSNLIDAAVIVSNNLGTIITTNSENTQGAVKRMTGLFYTTSSKDIVKNAEKSNIMPIFPYTGNIDQLEGVKVAIKKGYKNIAVSVAANENYLLESIKKLEVEHNVKIYKFGLCSTGIDLNIANIIKENADVVWSCASKYVKSVIEPNAIAQVGVKIPVHIMTKDGWEIIKNHLKIMSNNNEIDNLELVKGDEKRILLNFNENIKILKKKNLKKCNDCPYPCI